MQRLWPAVLAASLLLAPPARAQPIQLAAVLPMAWQPVNSAGTPCANVTAAGCLGGLANANAYLRNASRANGYQLATVAVHDDASRLIQFHPLGMQLNQQAFARLNASAWIIEEVTIFTTTEPSGELELRTAAPRLLFSNVLIPLEHKLYGLVLREQVVAVGPNRTVGLLCVMNPNRNSVYPLLLPALALAPAVDRLRNFYNVDAVVVMYTRNLDVKYTTLLGLDIDLIINGYPTSPANGTVKYVGNTAVLLRSELSDDELSEGEEEVKEVEKPPVDYEAIDEATGFKKVEWQVWQAYAEAVLNKPEDEREDRDEWAETYATENNIDKNRVAAVIKLGIYAGARDDFNQRAGEGKAIYNNGDTYEGHYWEGKKNGKGAYVYKSQGMSEVDRLLTEMVKARPQDEPDDAFAERAAHALRVGREVVAGHLRFGAYPCYHGDYINNMRHGHGVMRNRDGSVYQGYWKDNKRHGEGMFFFLNGDVYSGQWEDGLKHGAGCYTFANGVGHYTGLWQRGVFAEGQWHMTDGIFYEGRFDAKNRPCDPVGALKFPQVEVVQVGDYKKGVWAPKKDLIRYADYVPPVADEAGDQPAEPQPPTA